MWLFSISVRFLRFVCGNSIAQICDFCLLRGVLTCVRDTLNLSFPHAHCLEVVAVCFYRRQCCNAYPCATLLDSTFKLTQKITSVFKVMKTITQRKIIISPGLLPKWNCQVRGYVHFNSFLFYEGI